MIFVAAVADKNRYRYDLIDVDVMQSATGDCLMFANVTTSQLISSAVTADKLVARLLIEVINEFSIIPVRMRDTLVTLIVVGIGRPSTPSLLQIKQPIKKSERCSEMCKVK